MGEVRGLGTPVPLELRFIKLSHGLCFRKSPHPLLRPPGIRLPRILEEVFKLSNGHVYEC